MKKSLFTLVALLSLTLVACNDNSSSLLTSSIGEVSSSSTNSISSSSTSISSSSSSSIPNSSSSSFSSSSSSEKLDLIIKNTETSIKVGETLQVRYEVVGGESSSLTFTSSDADVATVSETGLITGIKEGNTVISVKLENITKSFELEVKKIESNDLTSILKTTSSNEIKSNNTGTYKIKNKLGEATYNWFIYSSDTITTVLNDNGVESKTQYFKTGDSIEKIDLTTTSISKSTVVSSSSELSDEEFKSYYSSFTLNNISTVSKLVSNYLTGSYFTSGAPTFSITHGSITKYEAINKYAKASEKKYYENLLSFEVDANSNLVSFNFTCDIYGEDAYNFVNNNKKADATKSDDSFSVDSTLKYDARVASDEHLINESDYHVKDFEVGSTCLHENNTMYVGEKIPLEIKVTSPAIYLAENFTIDDSTDINPQGVVLLTKDKNQYYIEASTIGTTTITVNSAYGVSKTITITVKEVQPTSIEITGLTSLNSKQKAEYKVNVLPINAKNKEFSASFTDQEMANYADLQVDLDNSKFIVTAKEISEDKDVTIEVKSLADEKIKNQITITIKKAVSGTDSIKQSLVGKTFKNSTASLTFRNETTGEIKLKSTNNYSFNWDLEKKNDSDYRIVFTNVTIVGTLNSSNKYTFDGNDNSNSEYNKVIFNSNTPSQVKVYVLYNKTTKMLQTLNIKK